MSDAPDACVDPPTAACTLPKRSVLARLLIGAGPWAAKSAMPIGQTAKMAAANTVAESVERVATIVSGESASAAANPFEPGETTETITSTFLVHALLMSERFKTSGTLDMWPRPHIECRHSSGRPEYSRLARRLVIVTACDQCTIDADGSWSSSTVAPCLSTTCPPLARPAWDVDGLAQRCPECISLSLEGRTGRAVGDSRVVPGRGRQHSRQSLSSHASPMRSWMSASRSS